TDAYTTLNASLAWKPKGNGQLRVFLDGRNLTDEEVREHASFLKDIAPSAGRSIRAGVAYRF
ncbi:MAG TPA: TonB-dependent receptor, partial [Caulobacter sp.]|nr:TonB-dependent receptor [Caulobacter sp.]